MAEIFVFGAGASHASGGTPLGKGLVWDYFEDGSGWYSEKEDEKEMLRRRFDDFGKFLQNNQERYPELRGIYSRWKEAIEKGQIFIHDMEKPYYIDDIMEDLICDTKHVEDVRLIKRLAGKHISLTSEIHGNSFYENFVKSLKGKTRREVSIISFNFDCLLRDDFDEKIYFDYLVEFNNIDSRCCFYKPGHGIPLFKLHGSLDWRLEPGVGEMTLLPTEWNEKSGGEACIFLPHEQVNKKIGKLWEEAAGYVRRAEKITFMGYSMPDCDTDARELFCSNVQEKTQIKVKDCSEDTINKYKELFPKKIKDKACDLREYNSWNNPVF